MIIHPSLGLDGSYDLIELDIDDSNASLESLGTMKKGSLAF
ncbi:MAG: hypothetical protein Q9M75_05220 [Ghiorsea sp.]|nr:hypothetical protein [Ghiorsea sp.]